MNTDTLFIEILGARGSVPVFGDAYRKYGGATSCFRLVSGREVIYFDAGSGIVSSVPEKDAHISILFSHLHLDHILGLPFFPALMEKDREIHLYGKELQGYDIKSAIDRIFSQPYWPLKIHQYAAATSFSTLPIDFQLGSLHVSTMDSRHPGGGAIIRVDADQGSVVYATDFEHGEGKELELVDFAKDCSLLIYDAQYTDAEYLCHRGFGHSTAATGIKIAAMAHAKQLLLTHHDPCHNDLMLDEMEKNARLRFPNSSFAKERQILKI